MKSLKIDKFKTLKNSAVRRKDKNAENTLREQQTRSSVGEGHHQTKTEVVVPVVRLVVEAE